MKYILNEDLFDDIQIDDEEIEISISDEDSIDIPDVQDQMEDGLANIINNELIGELETINSYRDALMSAEMIAPEAVPVLNDIIEEEHTHMGQLETLLDLLTDDVDAIEDGREEAEMQIETGSSDVGELTEDALDDAIPYQKDKTAINNKLLIALENQGYDITSDKTKGVVDKVSKYIISKGSEISNIDNWIDILVSNNHDILKNLPMKEDLDATIEVDDVIDVDILQDIQDKVDEIEGMIHTFDPEVKDNNDEIMATNFTPDDDVSEDSLW